MHERIISAGPWSCVKWPRRRDDGNKKPGLWPMSWESGTRRDCDFGRECQGKSQQTDDDDLKNGYSFHGSSLNNSFFFIVYEKFITSISISLCATMVAGNTKINKRKSHDDQKIH